jgi:lipid-A-disaccharide synthase
VLVLPGSRLGEIKHHLSVFGQALGKLHSDGIAYDLILPTMPHLVEAVNEGVKAWPVAPKVVTNEQDKRAASRIARAALAKSGTVTLELALAGVPMVTAYRLGGIEAYIIRRAIRVSSVILANLVLGRDIIPEFLQEDCTPDNLARALRPLLSDTSERKRQVDAFASLDAIMSTGNQPPSARAADIVLATMRKGRQIN